MEQLPSRSSNEPSSERSAVSAAVENTGGADDELRLLVPWSHWHRVFLRNLLDALWLRREPPLQLTSAPAPFWPDVFVARGMPGGGLWRSALYHAFLITTVWGFSVTWLGRPQVKPRNPFENSKLTYYPVSEYLPPLDTGSESAPIDRKGEPAYAKQRIISLPKDADNTAQTIVTPSPLKIAHDVPLPNIVAWSPVPAPVPTAAIQGATPKLALPEVTPAAPAPDVRHAELHAPALPQPAIVEPPPAIDNAKLRVPADLISATAVEPPPATNQLHSNAPKLPGAAAVEPPPSTADLKSRSVTVPTPAVVQPPPSTAALGRKLGELNVAHLEPQVAAPRLPLAPQRAIATTAGGNGGGGSAGAAAPPRTAGATTPGGSTGNGGAVAPPPSLAGLGTSAQASGQLIALGIHPVPPSGPIDIPQGNRRGAFAAGPEGKLGAPGTPDIRGGGHGSGGSGKGNEGPGTGAGNGAPAGIHISGGPVNPGPVAVAGPPANAAPDNAAAPAAARSVLLAAARPAHVADLARQTRPAAPKGPVDAPKIEDAVFGPKKYYSMTLNMPNLSSSGGTCIVRFAQLHEDGFQGDLVAPVAMQKVDPAYPNELRRSGIEGTITLYAVIHSDGSVGEVRVLRGLDERLDENARVALAKWRFRPGTKNGSAVDLEAVVQIPFQARGVTPF